jgi:hypothetical protein
MKPSQACQAQRGAATLVTVMIIFLVLALMNAYANRSLVFEQRIAGNHVQGSLALETADAGIEWALSQLNGQAIDTTCHPTVGAGSFRQRYLSLDPGTRSISVLPPGSASSAPSASCERASAQNWACQCPDAGAWRGVTVPAPNDPKPGFGIHFEPIGQPGVVRVVSTGCTGAGLADCVAHQGVAGDPMAGIASIRDKFALLSALQMPPAAPLVLRGTLSVGAEGAGLHNSDPRSGGLLMVSGMAVPELPGDRLDSLPGTPGAQALIGSDPTLQASAQADGMFKLFFGMPADKYRAQPAMRALSCNGDCSADIAQAAAAGARMVWIQGSLKLASDHVLGGPDSPLLIVADGSVTLDGPMTIHGLLYARGDVLWSNGSAAPALLSGALISEGGVQISGRVDLWYQRGVMDMLSNATGSFVRVPGSWSDSP